MNSKSPDDGNHHDRQTRRGDGLDIAKTALALDALPVEVDEGDRCKRPRHGKRTVGVLQPRNESYDVGDKIEEEEGEDDGHELLIALADCVLAHVDANALIAPFDHIGELVGGDDAQTFAGKNDDERGKHHRDDHPEDVLREADLAASTNKVHRIERVLQFLERLSLKYL